MYCYNCRNHETQNGFVPINHTLLWLIVPQILNGFAQLLVHVTTLQFICAQAPCTMQGLFNQSAVYHVQYQIHTDEFIGSCRLFMAWHTDLPGNKMWPYTGIINVVLVCVKWLPVQGGQCAMDGGRCH